LKTTNGDLASSIPHGDPLPRQSFSVRNIFYGRDGLRAGWSLLLFIAIFAAIAFFVVAIAKRFHEWPAGADNGGTIGLTTVFVGDSILLAIALFATWIMSKIEGRPFSVYGLGGARKLPNFLAGLAWGILFLSLLVLILWKADFLVIAGRALFGGDILRYSTEWLAAFLLVAVFEEFLFRGYIQYTLTRGLAGFYRTALKRPQSAALGFWSSAIVWAALFGFIHKGNPGESPIGLVCAGLASLLFSFSLWRTGSLWWAIGLHTAWDYSQSFLYGVGDSGNVMRQHLLITHPSGAPLLSGGGTGPEGSIFVLPVMGLIVAIIWLTLPRTSQDYAANLPMHRIEP